MQEEPSGFADKGGLIEARGDKFRRVLYYAPSYLVSRLMPACGHS